MSPTIITIVQARCSSTRLPYKVLRPLAGKTVLSHVVERVQRSLLGGNVAVATTNDPADDPIAALCRQWDLECYRGHPTDLLDRHYKAARLYDADAIVKVPSDCPLIDPVIIDRVVGWYLQHKDRFDYVSNLHPPTYPDGNDVEIMSMGTLERAWREANRPYEREHTTPYIWDNPHLFRIGNVCWEEGLDYSMTHRWVLDYEEDYAFIKAVYHELYRENPLFGINDILGLLERKPDIALLNQKYCGVNWYRHHLTDLKTIREEETRILEF